MFSINIIIEIVCYILTIISFYSNRKTFLICENKKIKWKDNNVTVTLPDKKTKNYLKKIERFKVLNE